VEIKSVKGMPALTPNVTGWAKADAATASDSSGNLM
jgi:hypothetical protein